jgi:heme/copper-type cytochrome/quinol oxidase subunit 3
MTTATARRAARPNGWYGMVILVATESAIFGTLVATYVYLRFQTAAWPPVGVRPPSITAPLVLALVLVAAAVVVGYASRAAAHGQRGTAVAALAGAFVIQIVYLGFQIHLYAADLTRFSPRLDAYASIYFTLLAVHHIHVGVGLVLDVWLLARLSRGLTPYRRTALATVALYWYFVTIAGLFVTATILSPSW